MNKGLRTVSILFGIMTSSVVAILVIWIWGDSEAGKKLMNYLWFQPFMVKILFSLFILVSSIVSIYQILKTLANDREDDGEGKDDQ